MTIRRACGLAGKAVLWAGVILAALMIASATAPGVDHPPTTAQTVISVTFVLSCAAVLGIPLYAVGRAPRRR